MSGERALPGTPRPVYVVAEGDMSIDVQDNALRFRCKHHADGYIPFRHISRMVIEEDVNLDLQVLCECARRGIPVVVYQSDDEGVLLRVVGRGGEDMGLRERLLDLTLDINWLRRIHDWRDANRSRIAAIVGRRMGVPAPYRQAASLTAWLIRKAADLADEKTRRITQKTLHTCIMSRMQRELQERGIDARTEAWLHDACDLAELLSELVLFQIQPLRYKWLTNYAARSSKGCRVSEQEIRREITDLFENHARRIDRTINDILNRLHRWLVDAT